MQRNKKKCRIYFLISSHPLDIFNAVSKCLTSPRFFNVMMSRGKCRSLFLCNNNDFKLVKRAMLAGRISIKLSHSVRACRCCKLPTLSGTSVKKFPPNDKTCNL